jgi:hypothetical protein
MNMMAHIPHRTVPDSRLQRRVHFISPRLNYYPVDSMSSGSATINTILEEIDSLDIDDRVYLHDILTRRLIEARRKAIAGRAKEARDNHLNGQCRRGTVDELLDDLDD